MTTHRQVKLSKLEWNLFNNLIENHIKELEPKIKHKDYTIYQLLSFDTSFSDNKNFKLISISEDNPYFKDEGTKMHRIIVLPIKINNSKFTKINLELKNENKEEFNILNKEMIFCDISNNDKFLNYEISEQLLVKDKNKIAYILFTIEKVSRNLTLCNYYNLYVKCNGKVLHKFKEISVRSKRKKRKIDSEESKKTLLQLKKRKIDSEVMPKKEKRKTKSDFKDKVNDKSNSNFTIKSFTDFIKININSLKRIESKVDQFQEDLNKFSEVLEQFKKEQNNVNNVNNISIKCFNDEFPKFDAILPSLGLDEMEY